MIEQVAHLLWSLAGLVVAVSLGVYLWRRPDSSFRMRHKDTEVELRPSQPQLPQSAEAQTSPPETREPDQPPPARRGEMVDGQVRVESRFQSAYKLLDSGEYSEGKKLLEEEARANPDLADQVSLMAFGQQVAATQGSKTALEDLKRTARDHQGVFEANLWLGIALIKLGMDEEAEAPLSQAFKTAASDEERARALNWRARSRSRTNREVIRVVSELLESSRALKEHGALSGIYAFAARLLLECEPPDLDRSFALYELAIKLAPADNSLRFELAYAYSEKESPSAAFLQYDILIQRDPKNIMGLNNLGVAASNLGLVSMGVDYYKRAEALGNTLAAANLAQKLINGGFLQEARAHLDPTVGLPDVHRNVLDALGAIAKRQSQEEANSKEILKAAQKTRALRVRIGEGLASGALLRPEDAGTYTDGAAALRVTLPSRDSVIGELTAEGETWDLSGSIVGLAILVRWERRKPEGERSWLNSLYEQKSGHGVFALDGNLLTGFTYEGDRKVDPSNASNFKEWNLRRQT